MTKLFADYERYNFFRQPDWRWQRVLKLCNRGTAPGRCSRRDDQYVRRARSFHQRWVDADDPDKREDLFFEEPGLYYAYEFFQRQMDDDASAMTVQARLLARQTPAQIADIMGVLPSMIEWYESLFFSVSEHLQNRDWITRQILVPSVERSGKWMMIPGKKTPMQDDHGLPLMFNSRSVAHPFFDGSLKLFAYFGGPILLDVMLTGFQLGKPLRTPDEAGNWWDEFFSDTIRRRSGQAALQFEINRYNVTELFNIHARLMELDRSDDTEKKTQTAKDRHIRAMIDEIPFLAGEDGNKVYDSQIVQQDNQASELRDHEMLKLPYDKTPPVFPPGYRPPRQGEAIHALGDTEI
jgi:hypothetical protein